MRRQLRRKRMQGHRRKPSPPLRQGIYLARRLNKLRYRSGKKPSSFARTVSFSVIFDKKSASFGNNLIVSCPNDDQRISPVSISKLMAKGEITLHHQTTADFSLTDVPDPIKFLSKSHFFLPGHIIYRDFSEALTHPGIDHCA